MSLNESVVEDTVIALPVATLIPAFSQRGKEITLGAIRRLNPTIAEDARTSDKESLSVQTRSKVA